MKYNNDDNKNQSSSIRLSELNSDLQHKFSKFNTKNDGELSIEEALQGLVTLQKQSNNYKKMLYLMVPIIIITLASIFGMNILAINLTKEIKTKTDSFSNSNYLVNNNGDSIKVESYSNNIDLLSFLFNYSPENLNSINKLQFGGYNNISLLFLDINTIHFEENVNNSTSRVTMKTNTIWFSIDSDGSYEVNFNSNIINPDRSDFSIYHSVSQSLNILTNNYKNRFLNSVKIIPKDSIVLTDTHPVQVTVTRPPIVTTENLGIGGFTMNPKCGKIRC